MLSPYQLLRRVICTTVLAVPVVALPIASVHAQAVTVNFNTLTEASPGSGTRYLSNCYVESGFVFTAVGVSCSGTTSVNVFLAGSANSPLFGDGLGSTPSLILNTLDASLIDITRVGGGTFMLNSIALGVFDGAGTTVRFTGFGAGLTVTQTFSLLSTQVGFNTFSLNNSFTNLTTVRITALDEFAEPLVKFDNVSLFAQSVVPEPSTIVLSAGGLFVLGALAQRQRRNHA